MLWFWSSTIKPLLEVAKPEALVEVGAAAGHNTANLLDWAADNKCVVHSIDPVPGFDVEEFKARHGDRFVFHRAKSHEVLGELPTPDVVLIDGDHNWWTVHGELTLIERRALEEGRPFPLTLFHDVTWPYARRDMYYNPEDVPEEFRQPHRKANIVLGQSALSEETGVNGGLFNAESEGTARNGVLTAVEDFMKESPTSFRFHRLHGSGGLGIMASEELLADRPELAVFLDWLETPEFLLGHCERIDRAQASAHMVYVDTRRAFRKANLRIAQLEKQVAATAPPPAAAATATHPSVATPPPAVSTDFDVTPAAAGKAAPTRRAAEADPLRELRVVGALPPELTAAFGDLCRLTPASSLSPDADLVLVAPEEGRPGTPGVGEAMALVEAANRVSVPSILWAIADRSRLGGLRELAGACSQTAVADPDAVPDFASAGASVAILPLAADVSTEAPDGADGRSGVVYVGDYDPDWPDSDKRVLAMLLDGAIAADCGLRIIPDDPSRVEGFPARFREWVAPAASPRERTSAIAGASALVAFSPGIPSRQLVPRLAFQAVGFGTPIVAFANAGVRHHLGQSAAQVRTPDEVVEAIRRLAARGPEVRQQIDHWRAVVVRGHTYRHRLASLASMAGIRAVP